MSNILIPVFSTDEIGIYAEKASQISRQIQCKVHLLYINANHRKRLFPFSGAKNVVRSNDFKLFDIQKERLSGVYPFLTIQYAFGSGNLKNTICAYCSRHEIEMVMFFEKGNCLNHESEKTKVEVSCLLEKLNCSVLTVKLHAGIMVANNIVVPIGRILPLKMLRIACHIGIVFRSTIHLVSTTRDSLLNGYDEAICLYKAYHLLHDNNSLPVKCTILNGNNTQLAAVQYAQKLNADIVLLISDKEPLVNESLNYLSKKALYFFEQKLL